MIGGVTGWRAWVVGAVFVVLALVAAQAAFIAAVGFAYFLGAAEEEVDWSTQPLEVVVGGPMGPCVLSFDTVAPGEHPVAVLAEGGSARVVVRDPDGRVVLRGSAVAGEASEVAVTLKLGTHRVECRGEGGTPSETELDVVPVSELE